VRESKSNSEGSGQMLAENICKQAVKFLLIYKSNIVSRPCVNCRTSNNFDSFYSAS